MILLIDELLTPVPVCHPFPSSRAIYKTNKPKITNPLIKIVSVFSCTNVHTTPQLNDEKSLCGTRKLDNDKT